MVKPTDLVSVEMHMLNDKGVRDGRMARTVVSVAEFLTSKDVPETLVGYARDFTVKTRDPK